MHELGTLQIDTAEPAPGRIVLRLSGELDLSTVPRFVEAIDGILDHGAASIELDLGDLGFIDSSGVGAYVTTFRRARARNCDVRIGARSALVDRVLELSGVERALAAGG